MKLRQTKRHRSSPFLHYISQHTRFQDIHASRAHTHARLCVSSASLTAAQLNSARISGKRNMNIRHDDEFVGVMPPAVVKMRTQPEPSSVLGEEHCVSTGDTDTPEDMDADFKTPSPLFSYPYKVRHTGFNIGKLSHLPLQLRFQVYNYLIDHDFNHFYWFYNDTIYLKSSSSKLPTIAHASGGTYREVMAILQNGHPCKLSIAADIITANFMLSDFPNELPYDTQYYCSDVLHVPSCKELTIRIQVPCPHNASGMVEVRQTVEKLVRILNSVALPLSRIRITFETNYGHAHQTFDRDVVHNDFALLIGPLYKLKHAASNGFLIDRFIRKAGVVDKRVQNICTMIEEAVRGNKPMELVTQQLCINIKLPTSKHLSDDSIYQAIIHGRIDKVSCRQIPSLAAIPLSR